MTHGRFTSSVDRAVAVGIICLVCGVLMVAKVAEALSAARVRVSRASRASLPDSGSRVALLRRVRTRDARMGTPHVEDPVSVARVTPGAVEIEAPADGVEPDTGLFI